MHRLRDPKTELTARIISGRNIRDIDKLLVVGCGSGVEAAILAQSLGVEVFGIDIVDDFDSGSAQHAILRVGDAMALDFNDNSFDFIYSYHALEHIPDPRQALSEMGRVLRPGGGFWIGTPNRLRALGYLGSKDATLSEKLKWNYIDWKARLSGEFRNECGAHAGFSASELDGLLSDVFSIVDDVTDVYFSTIYSRHSISLRLIKLSGLSGIIYPSIYFMGRK